MTKLRVIEEFLHYLKSTDKSENTIRNYQCDLSNFANWFHDINNEQLTLRKITPTDVGPRVRNVRKWQSAVFFKK